MVIIDGNPITNKDLLESYREYWWEFEQISLKDKDYMRSQLKGNHFILEIQQQEILLSALKEKAIVKGNLYSGLLLPSGKTVEEILIPISIELSCINRSWRITQLTTLEH